MFPGKTAWKMTVSIGIVEGNGNLLTSDELMAATDKASTKQNKLVAIASLITTEESAPKNLPTQ